MTGVTLGDFLRQADEHLEAALAASGSQPPDQAATARELGRLVAVMAHCLDDRTPFSVTEVVTRTDLSPWDRAAVDASTALYNAADCLDKATAVSRPASGPGDAPARCLAAAATALATGRDLMQTHRTTTPDELWAEHSPWAPAVTSLPATRALTTQITRWSHQLAPWAASLASADPAQAPAPAAVRDALHTATLWLWTAGAAAHPAGTAQPATADDARLLHAIPPAQRPERLPPSSAETMPELCAGINVSAERLRAAVFSSAERARWTPAATADTWRWTATAAAVTGHASEILLRSLASHPGPDGDLPLDREQLQAAAEAGSAWRRVSATWYGLTTETRGHAMHLTTELTDLVLRMGRLTWDDPDWKPTRAARCPLRDPAHLAPCGLNVVAAVHQACDAFACVAAAHLQAVTAADRAGRLYVTTRSLPGTYDVPRPYATAPTDRTKPILQAYRTAADANVRAARALADLALAADAPSSPLALARAAADPHHSSQPGETSQHSLANQAEPGNRPDAGIPEPGPVEQIIRGLRVADPILLLRAAAIDTAARALISQAERMPGQPRPQTNDAPARRHPPGNAARLAAKDNPPHLAGRTPGIETDNHAQAAPRRLHPSHNPQTLRVPRP
jgi:hypothetical protein